MLRWRRHPMTHTTGSPIVRRIVHLASFGSALVPAVVLPVMLGLGASAVSADAGQRRARLSRDLSERLATVEPSAATLSGGSVRVAERHACVFEGQPFAHVVVIYKDVAVSVLVAERGTGNAWWRRSTLRTMAVGGDFHIAEFDSADHAVFVVSTLPLADVQVIARAMMQPLANAIAGT